MTSNKGETMLILIFRPASNLQEGATESSHFYIDMKVVNSRVSFNIWMQNWKGVFSALEWGGMPPIIHASETQLVCIYVDCLQLQNGSLLP